MGELVTLEDKSLALQKEGVIDQALQMLSVGRTLSQASKSLAVDKGTLEYALTRNKAIKRSFLESSLFHAASKGMKVLKDLSSKTELEAEEKNAAAHHIKVSEVALKALEKDQGGGTNITVINNVVTETTIPPLPPNLKEVIEG